MKKKKQLSIKYILPKMIQRTLCTCLILMCSASAFAQKQDSTLQLNHQDNYERTFVVKPGGSINYSTPQKYGVSGEVYFGYRFEAQSEYSPQKDIFLKSISLEGSLNRGGFTAGIAYSRLSASIGTLGVKYGLFYYSNNSFSTVKEGLDMMGPEVTLHFIVLELSAGVLKEIDGTSVIPTLGFGIRLGPGLYD